MKFISIQRLTATERIKRKKRAKQISSESFEPKKTPNKNPNTTKQYWQHNDQSHRSLFHHCGCYSQCQALRSIFGFCFFHIMFNSQLRIDCCTKELQDFFLICRHARRQRSQSSILVTVRIDKHFKLHIDWSLSGKSKSSQLAFQVMESTSTFFFDSPISKQRNSKKTSIHKKTITKQKTKPKEPQIKGN